MIGEALRFARKADEVYRELEAADRGLMRMRRAADWILGQESGGVIFASLERTAIELQKLRPEIRKQRNAYVATLKRIAKMRGLRVCKCLAVLSEERCLLCRGTGRWRKRKCFTCHGTGREAKGGRHP